MANIPSGTDIMLDNNKLALTPSGDIALVSGDDNLLQSVFTDLRLIFGELDYATDHGNMIYHRRIKLTPNGLKQVEHDCRNAIMKNHRVADVVHIRAERIPNKNSCIIFFQIKKHDGEVLSSNTTINMGRE